MIVEALIGLVAVNLAAFAAFGWEKLCAIRNTRRVPESTLLMLALIGGTPGAFAARAFPPQDAQAAFCRVDSHRAGRAKTGTAVVAMWYVR